MSGRDAIKMTPDEVLAFLGEELVMTCATLGRDGHPHLMPLWFTVRGGSVWAWTYAKSQKVRNLERDPRCTLQIEAGGGDYSQLRGVMIKAEAVIHRDYDTVRTFGLELTERYSPGAGADAVAAIEAQAHKRVALEFTERGRATWDHRKLG